MEKHLVGALVGAFVFFAVICFILSGCAPAPQKKQHFSTITPATTSISTPAEAPDLSLTNDGLDTAALLLPLSGPSSEAGHALLRGLLAILYQSKNNGVHPFPELKVFDTHLLGAQKAAQKAIQSGAGFIVGPLTHNSVQALTSSTKINKPWLMLNYTDQGTPQKNTFQIGSSTKDEVAYLAEEAISAGYKKALVFLENTPMKKQLYQSFSNTWNQLGGQIIKTAELYKKENINAFVAKTLLINESVARKNALERALHEKLDFIPRQRKDVDMVFIIGSKELVRQINPALKFYFAGNLPVFSLSNIYNGGTKEYADKDLDGVFFACPEWQLQNLPLLGQIKQFWPNSANTDVLKLYVLGADVGSVYSRLFQPGAAEPAAFIQGSSGELSVNNKHQVYQRLRCATFKQGKLLATPLIKKIDDQINNK